MDARHGIVIQGGEVVGLAVLFMQFTVAGWVIIQNDMLHLSVAVPPAVWFENLDTLVGSGWYLWGQEEL